MIDELSGGVASLLKRRGVEVVRGRARFSSNLTRVDGGGTIDFQHCIIATGSRLAVLPTAYERRSGPPPTRCKLPSSRTPAGYRRRLHRPRARARLRRPRPRSRWASSTRGCSWAPTPIWSRSWSASAPPLDKILLESRVDDRRGDDRRLRGHDRARGRDGARSTTSCSSPSAASPTPTTSASRRSGSWSVDRGFIRIDAQCRTDDPHIFAIGDVTRRPDARAQGEPRGEGRRRGHRRPRVGLRQPRHPGGRLHRSRRSPGPASPSARRSSRASPSRSAASRSRPSAARAPWAAATG